MAASYSMKKYVTAALLVLGVQGAFAQDSFQLSGELNSSLMIYNLPSGDRGNSKFKIQNFLINLDVPLEQGNGLVIKFEGSDDRDTLVETSTGDQYQTLGKFEFGLREAYLDIVSPFSSMKVVRLGMIPQVWQEAHYQEQNYRFLGRTSWELTEKYNYLSYSDLGFTYMAEMPRLAGEWAISLYDGEGIQKSDRKAYKEVSLFFSFFKDEDYSLNLNLVYGNYDIYESAINSKERLLVSWVHGISDRLVAGMEVMYARDPMEAFADFNIANTPNLDDYPAEKIDGYGGSLYAIYKVKDRSEVFLRYDYLNAAIKANKTVQTGVIGYGYDFSQDIKLAVAMDYTGYSSGYGKAVRDESKLTLATQVLF